MGISESGCVVWCVCGGFSPAEYRPLRCFASRSGRGVIAMFLKDRRSALAKGRQSMETASLAQGASMAARMLPRYDLGFVRAGSWRHRPGWFGANRRAARLLPAFESFDDDHPPPATRAWRPRVRLLAFARRLSLLGRRRRPEQLPGETDIVLAAATGEQAIMADAVEPFRQNM